MLGIAVALMACSASVRAEDGYDLWLRYVPLEPALAADYRTQLGEVAALTGRPRSVPREMSWFVGSRACLASHPGSRTKLPLATCLRLARRSRRR